MSRGQLCVIAGAMSRSLRSKTAQVQQDALAKRWRAPTPVSPPASVEVPDVISLMDAWIRRLEREAASAVTPHAR